MAFSPDPRKPHKYWLRGGFCEVHLYPNFRLSVPKFPSISVNLYPNFRLSVPKFPSIRKCAYSSMRIIVCV